MSACRKGFTLVELLVVIAIIAVLAALVLPTLGHAQATAARARCTANLRQLNLAAQMYWDDNEGRCFRWLGADVDNGRTYWFGWLENGVEGQRRFDATRGALFPYLQGRGVEICPSLNYSMPQFKLKATGAAYGYGYNLSLSAPLNRSTVRVADVGHPAEMLVFADAAQVNTFQPPASSSHPMLEEFYYISTNAGEATVHFRHLHLANVGFCDGHVGTEPPLPGSMDLRLPDQWVGRLPDRILALR